MNLGLLTFTWLIPVIAALCIMFFCRPDQKTLIKRVGLLAGALCLGISMYAYALYLGTPGAGRLFVEGHTWIHTADLKIEYSVGGDGINLPMVLLTGFIMFTGILISWNIDTRTKEYFTLFLLLTAGVFGVFIAQDLFLLFVFYELAVFPMYLLIGVWGSTRKEYAAMKLTLYLMAGSALIMLGMITLYFGSDLKSFDMDLLAQYWKQRMTQTESMNFQVWVFPLVFVGFGVLAGMWPFHTWSPVGHVAAPTAVSMLHAGVLMKLGAYGCLKMMYILPYGAKVWMPVFALCAIVNVVYGSMAAMTQKDLKYVIGYSSVSHMGFVVLGLSSMNVVGMSGAVLQMFSHGIMTGLMFAIVGRIVYDRTHTRMIYELGGIAKVLPYAAVGFSIAGLASMGLPGLSGFVAELQIIMGVWDRSPILAELCGIAIVATAAYIWRVIHGTYFGDLPKSFAKLPPVTIREVLATSILISILFVIGLFPSLMLDMIYPSVDFVVRFCGF